MLDKAEVVGAQVSLKWESAFQGVRARLGAGTAEDVMIDISEMTIEVWWGPRVVRWGPRVVCVTSHL